MSPRHKLITEDQTATIDFLVSATHGGLAVERIDTQAVNQLLALGEKEDVLQRATRIIEKSQVVIGSHWRSGCQYGSRRPSTVPSDACTN